jgi:hypothetical protein
VKDTLRTRSCTVLFLFLSAFILSAVARADMAAVMFHPSGDMSGISHHQMMADHSGPLMAGSMSGCGDHDLSDDDNPPGANACQMTPDCTPDHCFSSHGLIGQTLAVVPGTAREHFSSGGYDLLSIVLAPPGRPPRHV